jgi:hypothetical protein
MAPGQILETKAVIQGETGRGRSYESGPRGRSAHQPTAESRTVVPTTTDLSRQ